MNLKQSKRYLEIVRSGNMDAMFDFGKEVARGEERKRLKDGVELWMNIHDKQNKSFQADDLINYLFDEVKCAFCGDLTKGYDYEANIPCCVECKDKEDNAITSDLSKKG